MEPFEKTYLDQYDSTDCRTWFFYPIYMPLNKNGEGPETRPGRVRKETWEVWDIWVESYISYDYLADAINHAIRLNNQLLNELLEGKQFDEIYSNIKARH